ncbi:hypothetical protein FA13DRAFT_1726927, partial [Coprinellus micaceus]
MGWPEKPTSTIVLVGSFVVLPACGGPWCHPRSQCISLRNPGATVGQSSGGKRERRANCSGRKEDCRASKEFDRQKCDNCAAGGADQGASRQLGRVGRKSSSAGQEDHRTSRLLVL